jgi:hypothetical protein
LGNRWICRTRDSQVNKRSFTHRVRVLPSMSLPSARPCSNDIDRVAAR